MTIAIALIFASGLFSGVGAVYFFGVKRGRLYNRNWDRLRDRLWNRLGGVK